MKDALELNPTLEIDQNAKVDQNAIDQSEFTTLSIPILFPDYVRDPTNLSTIRSISDDDIDIDDIETFAAKLKYLVKLWKKFKVNGIVDLHVILNSVIGYTYFTENSFYLRVISI